MMSPRSKPEDVARIREAAARGLTRAQIADELGLRYDRVKDLVAREGIPVVAGRPGPLPVRPRRSPRLPSEVANATERRCLCGCGRMFPSTHPGERIRPQCRDAWSARA